MDLSRFVDVRIGTTPVSSGVAGGETVSAIIAVLPVGGTERDWSQELYSLNDLIALGAGTHYPDTSAVYKAAQAYFNSGGSGLKVAQVLTANLNPKIAALGNKYINVLVVGGDATYAMAVGAATAINTSADVTIADKIIHYDITISEYNSLVAKGIGDNIRGLSVHVVGGADAHHSVRAMVYLSKCKATGVDIIKEYLFTNLSPAIPVTFVAEYVDTRRFNVFTTINGEIVAVVGGTTTNGVQLVERYLAIVALQRITTQLITYMTVDKPDFSASTPNELYNLITIELDRLQDSGWLVEGTAPETIKKTKDLVEYELLTEGEILSDGYKVVILPFNSSDMKTRTFRDIYVFLSTLVGITKFEIKGEVVR